MRHIQASLALLGDDEQPMRICLDFDGVLHRYKHGWTGTKAQEGPVEGALEFVEWAVDQDFEIVIYSCRDARDIAAWLREHGFPELRVVREKPAAMLYVDDRGYRFAGKFDELRELLREGDPGTWATMPADRRVAD